MEMDNKQIRGILLFCLVYTASLLSIIFLLNWHAMQEYSAHQNRLITFCVSTNLPYKQCKIESPYLTVIVQNETEFRQAITNLNATTIYYTDNWNEGFHVYVFSNDYKIAYRYYIP